MYSDGVVRFMSYGPYQSLTLSLYNVAFTYSSLDPTSKYVGKVDAYNEKQQFEYSKDLYGAASIESMANIKLSLDSFAKG
jgi:hypothetical protein